MNPIQDIQKILILFSREVPCYITYIFIKATPLYPNLLYKSHSLFTYISSNFAFKCKHGTDIALYWLPVFQLICFLLVHSPASDSHFLLHLIWSNPEPPCSLPCDLKEQMCHIRQKVNKAWLPIERLYLSYHTKFRCSAIHFLHQ